MLPSPPPLMPAIMPGGSYYCNFAAGGYRLPTEGEWEYFARAGTTTPFSVVEGAYAEGTKESCTSGVLTALEGAAWFCANGGGVTHPVGTKAANPWNLFDVHGNLNEYVWDWIGTYPAGPVSDYAGPAAGTYKVLRSGGSDSAPRWIRSGSRDAELPDGRNIGAGIRLLRTVTAVRLISANGGESLISGNVFNVTWETLGLSGNVTIELYKGGVFIPLSGQQRPRPGPIPGQSPRARHPGPIIRLRFPRATSLTIRTRRSRYRLLRWQPFRQLR